MRRDSIYRELFPYDLEIEQTFHRRRNLARQFEATIEDGLSSVQSYSDPVQVEEETVPFVPTITMAAKRSLKDYSQPNAAELPTASRMATLEAVNFELKHALLNMIERNQFGGTPSEDPSLHISTFLQCCATIKQQGVEQNQIRFMLFPFSLRDKARLWWNSLKFKGECTWNKLALAFYKKYYPPERTIFLRGQIYTFEQKPFESLYEAWERYKELQRLCPHHGLEKWLLVQTFYNGLGGDSRGILDNAANGSFMNLAVTAGHDLIEEMAIHNSQYGNPRGLANKGGKHEVDSSSYALLTSQMSVINQKLDNMRASNPRSSQPMSLAATSSHTDPLCENCGFLGHFLQNYNTSIEQVNAFQSQRQNNPFSNKYNEGYKNHPYLSYKSQNIQNPRPFPPQQQPRYQQQQPYQQHSYQQHH